MTGLSQRKYFCPRLMDYVLLVGTRNPNRNNTVAQTPELLRRYPLEDHSDFPLPPDIVFFCQPEGCISIGPKRTSLRESSSFVFTLTEKDSGRSRYGICINFYRPFARRSRVKPERIESTKSTESSNSDRGIEIKINSKHHRASNSASDTKKQTDINEDDDFEDILNDVDPSNRPYISRTRSKVRNHTLTSLCIISHHPFFSLFRECLTVLRKLIDACNLRTCGRKLGGPKGNFRDTVWGVLTSYGSDNTPLSVMKEVREIEMWILRLLSSPVPVPSKTRIELEVLPRELHPPLIFALPDHTRFSLVDYPLHLPLELLGVETCMKVLTCIMLEHKIIMQSRDYNALSMSVMAFVSMLFPLEYMFPVIPLLPTCMNSAEQLLMAPTPYIIGVPSSFLIYKRNFHLPDDVWIVDLDSSKVYQPRNVEPLPPLPEPEGTVLKNHLKQALASMSMSPQPIKDFDAVQSDEAWNRKDNFSSMTGFNPFIYGNDVDSVDIATRVAMIRFFNSPNILGHFSEHTRTLRLYPRPVVAFQQLSFLKSRPALTTFTNRLAKTQAVEFYAEWSLCPVNVVHMRVQTGVFDPSLIGDKAKWYSHMLQPVEFNVYHEQSTIATALHTSREVPSDENPTDESAGSGSDEESNSSSYSSLSDFVTDIVNSGIDGETPGETQTAEHLVLDENIFQPPSELHYPDPLVAPDSSIDSDTESSASSSPRYASDTEERQTTEEDSGVVMQSTTTSRTNRDSVGGRQSQCNIGSTNTSPNRPVSTNTPEEDPHKENKKPPPLHITKVEYQSSGSRPSTPGSPSTPKLKNDSDPDRPSTPRTPSSIISSLGSEISERAQSAGSTISEMFGSKAPPPRPPPPAVAKTRPYTPLGNRKALVEKSGLVKHGPPTKKGRSVRQQAALEQRSSTHSDNQQFLKDTVNQILEGRGVGWLKSSKVRRLMEDENYRNFVVSRLNTSLDKKLKDEDKSIEHVNVTKPIFKGMLAMLKAIILGLEHTYQNHGLGGMASALMVLEIIHTHYWQQDATGTKSTTSSQTSSPFGSRESLASMTDSPRSDFKPIESFSIIGSNKADTSDSGASSRGETSSEKTESPILLNGEEFQNLELKKNTSNMNNVKRTSLDNVIDIRDHDNNLTHTTELNKNVLHTQRKTSATLEGRHCDIIVTGSENGTHHNADPSRHVDGDMLRNKNVSNSGALTMQGVSTESEVSDTSTTVSDKPTLKTSRYSNTGGNHTTSSTDSYMGGTKDGRSPNVNSTSTGSKLNSESHLSLSSALHGPGGGRVYLHQALTGKDRSRLWDQMQFWEDTYLDAVAQERDIIGMDQGPGEMIDRYISLNASDRKRLEHDEDRLLSNMLYNLVGFMVMVNVNKTEIKRKVRRLLGKSHMGLYHSQEVNNLLDELQPMESGDVELRPLGSRLMQKQSFTVHWGSDNTGDMLFMEVCDDCIVLRSVMGIIHDRWWYEKLINMTYCPKTKVLCLWRKEADKTQLNKFYTKKCKELYVCVKEAMEKAALRNNGKVPGPELGGEFPVHDLKSGQGGLLQVCMEGIGLLLANSKFFIELNRIKKCYTQKGGIFVLEEFDSQNRKVIQRKYQSPMAAQIVFALHRIISVRLEMRKPQDRNNKEE